jgi:hypothetical protein
MVRVVKDLAVREEMCERLAELIKNVYDDDVGRVAALMQYKTESTLRKALLDRASFPDVERLHFLVLATAPDEVVPNMNWLLNGLGQPLLKLQGGEVVGHLSFGEWLDVRLAAKAA